MNEATLCPCGSEAVIRAERIVPGGEVDERVGVPVGQREISFWCQEHAELLVRTTQDRYNIVQLVATPRRDRKVKGQIEWELEC